MQSVVCAHHHHVQGCLLALSRLHAVQTYTAARSGIWGCYLPSTTVEASPCKGRSFLDLGQRLFQHKQWLVSNCSLFLQQHASDVDFRHRETQHLLPPSRVYLSGTDLAFQPRPAVHNSPEAPPARLVAASPNPNRLALQPIFSVHFQLLVLFWV